MNLKWKAIFFMNDNSRASNTKEKQNCLKSDKCPPQLGKLIAFEQI